MLLIAISFGQSVAFADNPPLRCAGYGDLQSMSFTDWEPDLDEWTVGTRNRAFNFDTPDWAVVENLPDSRSGFAAFVADQNNGDCTTEDKSGVLTLDSPWIEIPGGTQIPRISIEHWFEIDDGWDGGNLKIRVNDEPFYLIPASAIEFGAYTSTLLPPSKDGGPYNTNPLANQEAFTGTNEGQATGSWGHTYINLVGIAGAGDRVKLRFDFGVDQCLGAVGWYVDEVEFYSCSAELLPTDCGNGVIDAGEQCDDGNDFIEDGCSNTCQIEEGWQCTAPILPSDVPDHSFEAGTPNPFWTEVSNNFISTPICKASVCGTGGGSGPSDGLYWLWFGGIDQYQEGSVSQDVVIPSTEKYLTFDLEIPTCDSALDYVEVLIDGTRAWFINGSSPLCGVVGYSRQSLDLGSKADGAAHEIKFHSETFGENGSRSNFFIDDVALPGLSSMCTPESPSLTLVKNVINNIGGSANPADWMLSATGSTGFDGYGPRVSSGPGFVAGAYDLSESVGAYGYVASDWVCDSGVQNDADTITVGQDDAVTCTITNSYVGIPSLTLVNEVTNDNGGGAVPSDWLLAATGPTPINGMGPNVSSDETFQPGSYTLSQSGGPTGYSASDWVCDGGTQNDADTITLAMGEAVTCTISNDDDVPALTLVKAVTNNNGGSATPPDWTLYATGPTGISGSGPSVSSGPGFDAGIYDLSESTGPAGYSASAWVCDGGTQSDADTVTLALGESAICTIINDDDGPGLTLVNNVTNNNGGSAVTADWTLTATGPTGFSGSGPNVSNGVDFEAGTYDLSESGGPGGYAASSWACDGGTQNDADTITLTLGEVATCTITNDDIEPGLTLVKAVTNNNGGSAAPDDWTLTAAGLTGFAGKGPSVSNGTGFKAGSYDLSESGGPGGYTASDWACNGGTQGDADTITLAPGEFVTCTITNDDVGSGLTLVKTIINDNGGLATPADWTLTATGPSGFSGVGPSVSNSAGFEPGTYDLSESGGPGGYDASDWVCDGGTQDDANTITLALGESATCTIVNDDVAPVLNLVKVVSSNNGGLAAPADWTLTATDPDGVNLELSGPGPTVSSGAGFVADTYILSESDGPAGYSASAWACDGGDQVDATITLMPGEVVTCTITNNDDAPILTLINVVSNNNGGSALPSAWTLSAEGPTGFGGSGPNVSSGSSFDIGTYNLSESGGPDGYTGSDWVCDGVTQDDADTVTLSLGDVVTCTITNTDNAPGLTLIKSVNNDNGGLAVPADWMLNATGPTGFSGNGPSISNGADFKIGSYDLSESGGPAGGGYSASSWVCVGGTQSDADTIALALGESAICTITNDDNEPGLTLRKAVSNNNGGSALPSAWTLTATGPTGFSGSGPSVSNGVSFDAGSYDLSESGGPAGYTGSAWVCNGGTQDDADTVTLAPGEFATCTITNEDDEPGLTLINEVTKNNGGSAVEGDWTLTATGPTGFSGSGPSVSNGSGFEPGSYVLSQSGGPNGYTASAWVCNGGNQVDDTVTLALGESATCTIVNDDVAPVLNLVKVVSNNNGGLAAPADWTLTATDPDGVNLELSGPGPTVSSGASFVADTYILSESDGPAGYSASAWVCDGGEQVDATITLMPGDVATCTISNDDDGPGLTLIKKVINDNGGIALSSDWTLHADGGLTPFSGPGPSVSSGSDFEVGTYDLSETGGPLDGGYTPTEWVCVGGNQIDADTIELTLGQSAICTITNNDDPVTNLTLIKEVINNNGGSAPPSAWTLAAATDPNGIDPELSGTGPSVFSGDGFATGTYHLFESGGSVGYSPSAWVCNGVTQVDANTIDLAEGDAATCTITNNDDVPSLTLVKKVTNNNGGNAAPSAWTLTATGPTGFSGSGPNVSSGASFDAGSYVLSESSGPAGYTAGAWVCVGGTQVGTTISLALGESATCTITNDDDGPGLTLINTVKTDNGGTAVAANWMLNAVGPTPFSGLGPFVANPEVFEPGSYNLSYSDGPAGYTAGAWICDGGTQNDADTITLALGEAATCTLSIDDNEPGLSLRKAVSNNNGGSALPSAWTLTATGPTGFSGSGPSVSNGVSFDAGSYDLSESGGPAGYTGSAWVCNGGTQDDADTVTLAPGEFATCTITNEDDEPGLTLINEVTKNNGGSAVEGDWTLTATGPTGFSGSGPSVSNGSGFEPGSYVLSQSGGPNGYTASAWVCNGGSQVDDTVTLALGESATCTIVNDDVAPVLNLVKVVSNNNGGLAAPADWTLTATDPDGVNLELSGPGPTVSSGAGFVADTYVLSESDGPAGYSASAWVCDGGDQVDATITLMPGEVATCTITNNDDAPSLTLVKKVTNDNGGKAAPSAWTLKARGSTGFSGSGPTVSSGVSFAAGSYDLSEEGGPAGYTAGAWVCVGGTQVDTTVTLALGESATCTITNDDDVPSLILVKAVTTDNGGTAVPSDWILTATGPTGFSGNGPNVSHATPAIFAAGSYNLSESGGPAGYIGSSWVCNGGTQNDADTITLALGEAATCTITNNDDAPSLTLVKKVTNDNGGKAAPSAWTLKARGSTGFSGSGPTVSSGVSFAAGSYDLSEEGGPAGYTAGAWVCVGGTQVDTTVTLALGESATCTITNDDDAPSLTLVKAVTTDNGGTAAPSDWTLTATGPTGFSGIGPNVSHATPANFKAGSYDLSESGGPAGYTGSAWVCDAGTQNDADTVTLALGESATCTITNDDDAPSLTLVKKVTNNNGGNAAPSAWTLTAAGPTGFSGNGPNVSHATPAIFEAGSYVLSESGGPDGYTAGAWVCDGGTQVDTTVTLALGESATCTITNDDDGSGLTLVNSVTTDNGGTAVAADWTLNASGPTPFSDSGPSVSSPEGFKPGTYTLSLGSGLDGYTASFWVCSGGNQIDDTVTLALGESATCTISINDIEPGLTLIKKVVNNGSGTASASAWTLSATGPSGFGGKGPTVSNGEDFIAGTYDLSESAGQPGYTASDWVCRGVTQDDGDTITLKPGENATCTITNTDTDVGELIFGNGFESK